MAVRDQYRPGMSISALSRETGRDRKTIHEIVTVPAPRAYHGPARVSQPRLLDPYTA